MTAYANTFEGGTLGTTITTGNSGGASGDAWDTASLGAGDSVAAYDNTHTRGSFAAKIATVTSATVLLGKNLPALSATAAARCYVYLTAFQAFKFFEFDNASATLRCSIGINSSGKINPRGNGGTSLGTFVNALPLNTWCRLEAQGTTFSTTGTITVAFYPGDSLVATESNTYSSVNLGGTADRIRYGVTAATASVGPYWLADTAENDTGVAIGPLIRTTPGFLSFM